MALKYYTLAVYHLYETIQSGRPLGGVGWGWGVERRCLQNGRSWTRGRERVKKVNKLSDVFDELPLQEIMNI